MLERNLTIVTVALVSMLTTAGMARAEANQPARDEYPAPATKHQAHTLNLQGEQQTEPRFQFGRQGNDFVAVMPVTRHQADVLNLQKGDIGYRNPEDMDEAV